MVFISTTFFDAESGHNYDPNEERGSLNRQFSRVPDRKIMELIHLLGLSERQQARYRRLAVNDLSDAFKYLVETGYNPDALIPSPITVPDHYPDDQKNFLEGLISGELTVACD